MKCLLLFDERRIENYPTSKPSILSTLWVLCCLTQHLHHIIDTKKALTHLSESLNKIYTDTFCFVSTNFNL